MFVFQTFWNFKNAIWVVKFSKNISKVPISSIFCLIKLCQLTFKKCNFMKSTVSHSVACKGWKWHPPILSSLAIISLRKRCLIALLIFVLHFYELRVRLAHSETGLSPALKYFISRYSEGSLLMPCGHLLGKGWPLGSRLWWLIVKLSLSHWYPGTGVVLDCIDSWSLPLFLTL